MLRFSKRFTLTLGAVLALALSPIIQAQTGKRLALVQVNQQALYFTQITQGAQAAAKAAGAELVVFNANDNPAAQNDAIEAYIQDKVDAILVCAIDVNGIKPAVTAAAQAGIPVVAIDAVINGDNAVQVGVDIGANAESVRRAGVNHRGVLLRVYMLSGMAAALAGMIVTARLGSGSSNQGEGFELEVIAAVVLGSTSLFGGFGTIVGTLLGVLTMAAIKNGLILAHVSPFYTQIATGLIVLLAIWLNTRILRTGRPLGRAGA